MSEVRLRVGGVVFEAEKESLLRFDHTFFHGLFSSGLWQPESDGAYFIDRPALGFDRILEYLSSGKLRVEGSTQLEEECVYSSLDYLLIPYKRLWHYTSQVVFEGFGAKCVCELKDGRLCAAYEDAVTIWNTDTSTIETLEGHTKEISRVIQLYDGRICSCSKDTTIKLWSIDSKLCELTLTGHTDGVDHIMQLLDKRICSGSWDETILIWNTSNGVCEMTIIAPYMPFSLSQLADGRICCGDNDGTISIYSLLTGECELSWETNTDRVNSIVCIDATRICSGSSEDGTIKVWSIATGECERTLEAHTGEVMFMVLMQDGRLCSSCTDGAIKIWNLQTGECESTLNCTIKNIWRHICQLGDGRIVCADENGVRFWS